MSTVIVSEGSARNSSQAQRRASSTSPVISKVHSPRGVCGVGPAERTGKLLTVYWPGGRRSPYSASRLLPKKPRVIGLIDGRSPLGVRRYTEKPLNGDA